MPKSFHQLRDGARHKAKPAMVKVSRRDAAESKLRAIEKVASVKVPKELPATRPAGGKSKGRLDEKAR
jgi:hypothetical protein